MSLSKIILQERYSRQYLYHFTLIENIKFILKDNTLKVSPNTSRQDFEVKNAISLTRKFDFSKEYEHFGNVRLTLNWDLLRTNYKIIQYDFYNTVNDEYKKSEAEEIVLVKEGINNLNRYLIQIDINKGMSTDYVSEIQFNKIIKTINELTDVPINIVDNWKPVK